MHKTLPSYLNVFILGDQCFFTFAFLRNMSLFCFSTDIKVMMTSIPDELIKTNTVQAPLTAAQPVPQPSQDNQPRRGRPRKTLSNVERKYQCNICLKEFKRNDNLQTHLSAHSGVKQHRCDVCGSSFVYKRSLKRHQEIHVKKKPMCTIIFL